MRKFWIVFVIVAVVIGGTSGIGSANPDQTKPSTMETIIGFFSSPIGQVFGQAITDLL